MILGLTVGIIRNTHRGSDTFSKFYLTLNDLKNFSYLASMIEGIRAEEIQNTRILLEHQHQIKRQKQHDKIVNRIRFLRQSCRCRFVCTGLHIYEYL